MGKSFPTSCLQSDGKKQGHEDWQNAQGAITWAWIPSTCLGAHRNAQGFLGSPRIAMEPAVDKVSFPYGYLSPKARPNLIPGVPGSVASVAI